MVMEKTDLVLLVVELIFRITICTIREKKWRSRYYT